MFSSRIRVLALAAVVALAAGAASAGELKLASADGESWIKFGFLAQMKAESADTLTEDGMATAKDLYFRRLRLLFGGQINAKWGFFIDTDSPNLGKGNADGTKNSGDVYIQDFAVTWTHNDAFKVDMGMLLVPFSHNSTQSAATLLPIDYGPYSFLASTPTDSRVGRDYGLLAKGLVAKHFEYRVGLFQGDRGVNAENSFRYAARVVYSAFEPDAGLFYTGTTLGKKKILTLGAAIDAQEDYQATAVDFFWDQPFEGGNALTLQAALMNYDGDVFFPSLPEQTALQGEFGFYFAGPKLMPFVAYSDRDFDDPTGNDETILQVGLSWYPAGHGRALKLGYAKLDPATGEDRDQIALQLQLFQF
jgi:hypothetical protein